MPRTARMLIDGGVYHVLARGNNGQAVFHVEADYHRYLGILSTYVTGHQLKVYHYVLMPDHVHLVLQTDRGKTLSHVMRRN